MADKEVKLLNNPYGEVTYDRFRQDKRAFVDKSLIIKSLDSEAVSKYPVLLRPRRFGKSTFVQMLKCFYDISYKDRYEELFKGTAIYDEHLDSHNTYHVINFDFSGISGKKEDIILRSFIIAIESGITEFMVHYPDFVFNPSEEDKLTPSGYIRSFFNAYKKYPLKQSLYLMIDEYDNFANNVLSQDLELFKAITSTGGFIKDFYATIKIETQSCIAKTFITGVSSVSLDSLTSGFNISRNITSHKSFNVYAGFTEEELKKLIPELVDINTLGVTVEEMISRMKPVYDGYCFSRLGKETVYNSSMCLYYLNSLKREQAYLPPELYLDPASDHDGSKLQQVFEIAEDGLADKVMDTYLKGDYFYIAKLAEHINLNKHKKYDEVQLISMLYYLGYLTIDPKKSDAENLALKIPNLFMSNLFAQCTLDMRLKPSSIYKEQPLDISDLEECHDDISGFVSSCSEFLSSIFTNQVLTHMSEMALNLALYGKLNFLIRDVKLQMPLRVPGKGEKFADLVLTVNLKKQDECVYLFELKYIAKTQATEAKIEALKEEAAEQVNSYKSSLEFKNKNVKGYALIFSGSECVYWG